MSSFITTPHVDGSTRNGLFSGIAWRKNMPPYPSQYSRVCQSLSAMTWGWQSEVLLLGRYLCPPWKHLEFWSGCTFKRTWRKNRNILNRFFATSIFRCKTQVIQVSKQAFGGSRHRSTELPTSGFAIQHRHSPTQHLVEFMAIPHGIPVPLCLRHCWAVSGGPSAAPDAECKYEGEEIPRHYFAKSNIWYTFITCSQSDSLIYRIMLCSSGILTWDPVNFWWEPLLWLQMDSFAAHHLRVDSVCTP